MSLNDLEKKIEELKEWEALFDEAQKAVEGLRDEIKAEMAKQDAEELQCGKYIVRWTSVLSNRFDSSAFKAVYADLYKEYTKQVKSKRFSIA